MITRRRFRFVLVCALASAACHQAARTAGDSPVGTAVMRSPSGASHGTLQLHRTAAGSVRVTGTLTGLPPGPHGIHFHQVGRCDAPDFTSAGPHVNPTGALHGLENPLGPHAGDLPNVAANAAGEAVVDLVTARVTSEAGGSRSLFDGDGTTLIIHAAPDDQRSDPAGNSGARIACGVVGRV